VPSILEALERHERERQALRLELGSIDRTTLRFDPPAVVRKRVRGFLGDWEGLLAENMAVGPVSARSRLGGPNTFPLRAF
jgi:hypothetical protein